MNINLIKKYIKLLKKEDINNFLKKNNISVNDIELDFIYETLNNNYKDIINEDKFILENIKNNINKDAFNKLIDLFNKYKTLNNH